MLPLCKLLSANVYNYSGSKLEIGGQFAYQTTLSRNSLALVHWDVFTQQTGLIGKIIFQLLWIRCGLCACVRAYIFVCMCVCIYSIQYKAPK